MCWFRRRLSSSVSGVCRCSTTMIRGNCSRVRLICSVCGVFVILVCLIIFSLSEMVFSFDIYWVSASHSPYPQSSHSYQQTPSNKLYFSRRLLSRLLSLRQRHRRIIHQTHVVHVRHIPISLPRGIHRHIRLIHHHWI